MTAGGAERRAAAIAARRSLRSRLRDDGRGPHRRGYLSTTGATFLAVTSITLSLVVDRQTGSGQASSDWGAKLGYTELDLERVTTAAVALLRSVQEAHRSRVMPIFVGGVVGPRYESATNSRRFTAQDARRYHRPSRSPHSLEPASISSPR